MEAVRSVARKIGLSWLYVAGMVCLCTLPVAAADLTTLDAVIADAASQTSAQELSKAIERTKSDIRSVATQAIESGEDAPTLLSSRSRIVEALEASAQLQSQGDILEALRLLTRAVALSASVADTEQADSKGRKSLDPVTWALYKRVVRLGGMDTSDSPVFTIRDGERLIYRVFFINEGKLVSAELVGNDKAPKAEWRQAAFPTVDGVVRKDLERVYQSVQSDPTRASARFVLLIFDGSASGSEEQLIKALQPALNVGILPVVAETAFGKRPILPLPGIRAASGDGGKAELIERSTAAVVASWNGALSAVTVASAVSAAQKVMADIDIAPAPVDLAAFARSIRPADKAAAQRYRAVVKVTEAALSNADGNVEVLPWSALVEKGRAAPDWIAYSIYGTAKEIWLRDGAVGSYIEYPASLTSGGGFLSWLSGSGSEGEQEMIAAATVLRTRPHRTGEALSKLPAGSQVAVMHSEIVSGPSATGADKDAGRTWAFVRVGDHVGWIEVDSLAAEKPAREELGASGAARQEPGEP